MFIEHRDTGCQTEASITNECGEAAGGWCAAAGACARVTRAPAGADAADVLIVLLHHHHAVPRPISDLNLS